MFPSCSSELPKLPAVVDAKKAAAQKRDGTVAGGAAAAAAARPLLGAELLVSYQCCLTYGMPAVPVPIASCQQSAVWWRLPAMQLVAACRHRGCCSCACSTHCLWPLAWQVKLDAYMQQFLDGAYDLLMGQASPTPLFQCLV